MSSPRSDLSDAIHLLCNETSKDNEWYNYSVVSVIGKRFGKLTVVSKANERYYDGAFLYECKCDCSKTTVVKMHKAIIVISA